MQEQFDKKEKQYTQQITALAQQNMEQQQHYEKKEKQFVEQISALTLQLNNTHKQTLEGVAKLNEDIQRLSDGNFIITITTHCQRTPPSPSSCCTSITISHRDHASTLHHSSHHTHHTISHHHITKLPFM